MTPWNQVYDPFGNPVLSVLAAVVPVGLLLAMIASGKIKPHIAAILAMAAALAVAVFAFTMPFGLAIRATGLGVLNGMFPIGWIILNVMFLYRLTVERGWFGVFQQWIGGVTPDRRLQLLLIAFCFGAFFEGAAGFGTPVAVTAAILLGLGFSPLAAAGLSLIANTAPVAFGALGAPIQGLATATGIDPMLLGQMIGRQLPFFSILVPFWLIWVFAGFRGMLQIWPAILVCGVSFAIPQFVVSNFINPWIVDLVASAIALVTLIGFLKVWKPAEVWTSPSLRTRDNSAADMPAPPAPGPIPSRAKVFQAALPWAILCLVLVVWASADVKKLLDGLFAPAMTISGLNDLVVRVAPVVAKATPEHAIFKFTGLSYTGTGILVSALISGALMGLSPLKMAKTYLATLWTLRYSLATIAAMLAVGTLTRFSGIDATLGLAFAKTGFLYPFFGALLGWLGVAATGSDTASNVLFGGLQKITSEQLGLSPILMAAANSSGGVMGKMIDTQSIVVASTATGWYGHEGSILRFVFWNSLILASLVGGLIMLQAYVWPFTAMVVH
ncbi:L-lactate permease [soil metagenome]